MIHYIDHETADRTVTIFQIDDYRNSRFTVYTFTEWKLTAEEEENDEERNQIENIKFHYNSFSAVLDFESRYNEVKDWE